MLVVHVSMIAGRTFKNNGKSNGPRIDPYGAPAVTGKGLERCPLTTKLTVPTISQKEVKTVPELSFCSLHHTGIVYWGNVMT